MSDPIPSTPAPTGDATNGTIPFTFEEQVMAYTSLYAMALICIIWGSIRSLAFVQSSIARKELLETSITTKEAKKFPITASLVLFTLYIVFKTNDGGLGFVSQKLQPYLPSEYHQVLHEKVELVQSYFKKAENITNSTIAAPTILEKIGGYHPILANITSHPITAKAVGYIPEMSKQNLIFFLLLILCWEGCVSLAVILKPVFSGILSRLPVGDRWPRKNVPYLLSLKKGKKEMKHGQLEKASKKEFEYLIYGEYDTHLAIAFFFTSWVGISHLYRRHWITNDLLGIAFSVYGIENLHLASFKAGAILLSGLFIYDVFWVFATDVMTTVAKGIDAPILLMFPQDLLRNGWMDASKHGMLGLGDIVIPGIFIALLYRFDHYVGTKKGPNSKNRYYCAITVFAYALGLLVTMGVMHYFKAAQPALLYLVPTCVLIPLFAALLRGEFKALWNYSEDHLVDKDEKEKPAAEKEKPTKEQGKEKKNK
jgi:minor histocompatibility antigen H13